MAPRAEIQGPALLSHGPGVCTRPRAQLPWLFIKAHALIFRSHMKINQPRPLARGFCLLLQATRKDVACTSISMLVEHVHARTLSASDTVCHGTAGAKIPCPLEGGSPGERRPKQHASSPKQLHGNSLLAKEGQVPPKGSCTVSDCSLFETTCIANSFSHVGTCEDIEINNVGHAILCVASLRIIGYSRTVLPGPIHPICMRIACLLWFVQEIHEKLGEALSRRTLAEFAGW